MTRPAPVQSLVNRNRPAFANASLRAIINIPLANGSRTEMPARLYAWLEEHIGPEWEKWAAAVYAFNFPSLRFVSVAFTTDEDAILTAMRFGQMEIPPPIQYP
jgi:hypothetical protein